MKYTIILSLLLIVSGNLCAQHGYSSASVSMTRANGISSPDQVIIEEYINYHTHGIKVPRKNNDIALSLELNQVSKGTFVLQTGIATKRILDFSEMPPINISLVIDKSGSMQSDMKLEKVKKALTKFIKGLRPDDIVSIVAYDSAAKVILSSQKVKDIANLELIIQGLRPGGSTNLYGGLILGYKEVEKSFSKGITNKVVLLTDGIANVGITKAEKITEDSYSYNQNGIDISTIGVGNDINYGLLQQLAERGRGANHFVGNHEEDIVKVFEDELESLLYPVAKEVELVIEFPDNVKIESTFGYQPEYNGNKIKIPLKNINGGLTQVVLSEFSLLANQLSNPVKASLKYTSSLNFHKEVISEEIKIRPRSERVGKKDEVYKNYQIGRMARSLKSMGKMISEGDFMKAQQVLDNSITEVEEAFPQLKDKDIQRIKKILIENRNRLGQITAME